MRRTIEAIERHLIPPVRLTTRHEEFGLQPSAHRLVAEWQQRGPETLCGHALQKLRLTFASLQSVTIAGEAG
jgi:hypothetical protein